jgi:hypothetical protein
MAVSATERTLCKTPAIKEAGVGMGMGMGMEIRQAINAEEKTKITAIRLSNQ